MNSLIIYLAEASLACTLLFGCYWLIARQHTFHQLHRALLLALMPVGMICPLLTWPDEWKYTPVKVVHGALDLTSHQEWTFSPANFSGETSAAELSIWTMLGLVYLMGVVVMLWRFGRSMWWLRQQVKQAQPTESGTTQVWLSTHPLAPFSFFSWILMPAESWTTDASRLMLAHERAHVQQGHSWDNLFVEACLIVGWFNPVAWMWRRSVRKVHEYLADEAVLQQGHDPVAYLHLLAQQVQAVPTLSMVHSFRSPIILNRLRMLTSPHSPNWRKHLYILLLPAFGLLFAAFDSPLRVQVSVETPMALSFNFSPISDVAPQPGNEVPNIRPIEDSKITRMSSGFGMRLNPWSREPQHHTGVDFAAKEGTPVLATADGVVVEAKLYVKTWGNRVLLKHNAAYETLYAHMQGFIVEVGETVKQGQVIGYVGNTGRSTKSHLHYEVHKDGTPVDPAAYFPE